MNTRYFIIIVLMLSLLSACIQEEHAKDEPEEGRATITTGLFLSAEQLKYSGIEYGDIHQQSLSHIVNARGKLVLPINAIIDHVSKYPGMVSSINVKEGKHVQKGQLLASISSSEFVNAQQRYIMVKNQLVMLEQEYERQKELNEDKVSSDKKFEKALADYNVAIAELTGLGLQLSMAGVDINNLREDNLNSNINILSQQEGYVEGISANPGKYVMDDECIMQVINREQLLVELNVFEKDIMLLQAGQKVSFTLSNLSNKVYEAKIISIGNIVNEENRVIKVLAEFRDLDGRMLPGMFVASEIHTGEATVTALPDEALVRLDDGSWIFYYTSPAEQEKEGTIFHTATVNKGITQKGMSEITLIDKIPSDARIVIKGAYSLKTEQAKQAE